MLSDNDLNNNIKNNTDLFYKASDLYSSSIEMSFIFKKTEKIAQGLFMATNHIKDNDYIKWFVREKTVDMFFKVINLNNDMNIKKDNLFRELFLDFLEIISTIRIMYTTGLVRIVNANILIEEITKLTDYINKNVLNNQIYSKNIVLNDDFFKINTFSMGQNDVLNHNKTNSSIEKESSISNTKSYIKGSNYGQNNTINKDNLKDKKNNRRDQIVELLKRQGGLTIKDFLKVVTGCSEKTIQRELIILTKLGLVKRDGERRWSKYSLVQL